MATTGESLKRLVCWVLFRFLLPLVLVVSAAVRYNAVSFLYTVLLLVCPFVPSPSSASIRGVTGMYLKFTFIFGLLVILGHAAFHITLTAVKTEKEPYGSMFPNCSLNDKIARQVIFERLDNIPVIDIIRLVLPDVAVFTIGLIVYIICLKLLPPTAPEQSEQLPTCIKSSKSRAMINNFSQFIGEAMLVFFVACSGIILPSIFSAVYFLTFLILATMWSFHKKLGAKFAVFRILLLFYCGAHILTLHLYQFQFFQDFVKHDELISRILGLTAVVRTDCSYPQQMLFYDPIDWPSFVNPAILLLLFYTLAFEIGRKVNVVADPDVKTEITHANRRQKKDNERQVASRLDRSQTEHLVDAEVPNYSSTDTECVTVSGSTTMLGGAQPDFTDDKHSASEDKRSALVSMLLFIMRQSYMLALIAMMAWSITYHSWLTFVLLLAACIIWMFSNSRRVCHVLSPFLLLYTVSLLVIQFIYGLNLSEKELPLFTDGIKRKYNGQNTVCLHLALQVFYTLWIWITLRQFVRDRIIFRNTEEKYVMKSVAKSPSPSQDKSTLDRMQVAHGIDTVDGQDSNSMRMLGQYFRLLLCKYWIFVCTTQLLLISLQEVTVYRIIYMILFLMFVLCFQYAFSFWRLTMKLFWWVIIIYSMLVLIMLYTYQFDDVALAWQNSTGLTSDTLYDIGLEKFNTAGLALRLLSPTSFLVSIIIQVHFFHGTFLQLCDPERFKKPQADVEVDSPKGRERHESKTSKEDPREAGSKSLKPSLKKRLSCLLKRFLKFASGIWKSVTWFLWRLAEIHIFKVVAFVIIMVTTYEVSAVSAVYVILLSVFLPLTGIHIIFSHIAQFWTALVLLAKMIYQLKLVDNRWWLSNCTKNETSFYETIDSAEWAGMRKTDNLLYNLRNFIGILLIIAFERIVVCHQRQYYASPNCPKPNTGIIFSDIKRAEADGGIIPCLKYFLNYFFYKFGLELCYIMTAITICVRTDVIAVLYAFFLGILLLTGRTCTARLWPIYTIILVILLPIQFLSCLGVPKYFCYEYLWNVWKNSTSENLTKWLYLPDYNERPSSSKLIADFFQLLFVCFQWRVFRMENKRGDDEPDGGNNDEIYHDVEAKAVIPVDDFTTKISSYLDLIKNFVFTYMYWVTLAIVFLAGTTRINIFGMGYIIAVFCFMWLGQDFLIKPLRQLCRAWNFLIGYCYLVIFLKAALQLPGCVYMTKIENHACWLVQLLGLTCLGFPQVENSNYGCVVEKDNIGLAWDVVCFVFLLLQRRIYTSHYFRHVANDFEAQNKLASRGCQLINRILMREVQKQKAEEQKILEQIIHKMDRLRAKQLKLKKDFLAPTEHFQAIRSGDYYLFDDSDDEQDSDDEITTITYGQGIDVDTVDAGPSPFQLISTAVTSGTDEAVKQAKDMKDINKPTSPKIDRPEENEEKHIPTTQKEEAKDGILVKIKNICKFVLAFITSVANGLSKIFNRISRNYRLVAANMADDHLKVKYEIQMQHGTIKMSCIKKKDQDNAGISESEDELVEISVQKDALQMTLTKSNASMAITDVETFDVEEFEQNQSCIYQLLKATYYVIIAKSELVCFFLMILNHILSASLLTLPLPMFVFLWGMLSVPRPTKTFWITVITFSEAVVVVKYLFQFGFYPWIERDDDPFWPPKIIGIQKKDHFATVDIILLLALFIHRTILKRYGLWKDDTEPVNKKSFELGPKMVSIQTLAQEDRADNQQPSSSAVALDLSDDSTIEQDSHDQKIEDTEDQEPKKISRCEKLLSPFVNFYKQLTCLDYSATTDVYAPMFACDFINFLIIVFGYQSFGPSQTTGVGDVASYITEDRIPVPFLFMLLVQFILIIIDRALYLRKNILGKFIFQIVLVVLIHMWMFFLLPYSTKKSFISNTTAQVWYFIKCVYFALSAYQIRSSYPTRILGNFLTKKYSYLNLFLFKGFLAIPFLLELRTLMDWMWTKSTMAIGSWLQMEDIYANIYILKCYRVIEKNYPTTRSVAKPALIKYSIGGLLLLIIIFIIWFPLVIFSFANTVYVQNPPIECTVSISLNEFQPLFTVTGLQQNIPSYTDNEYQKMKIAYDTNAVAMSFLNNYYASDVTKIQLNGKSSTVWTISPPSRQQLEKYLSNLDISMELDFYATFTRAPNTANTGNMLSQQFKRVLTAAERFNILCMLNRNLSSASISATFPKYLRLGSKAASPANALLGFDTSLYSGISISVYSTSDNMTWWFDVVDDNNDNNLTLTTFNDRVAPSGVLSLITGYGIIGLYMTFILLIGRMLRLSTTGMAPSISFLELPNVDNILRLCLDLYLVREMQKFELEEDLYAKLIFVYRSSETRIRWTRLKASQMEETKKKL